MKDLSFNLPEPGVSHKPIRLNLVCRKLKKKNRTGGSWGGNSVTHIKKGSGFTALLSEAE